MENLGENMEKDEIESLINEIDIENLTARSRSFPQKLTGPLLI